MEFRFDPIVGSATAWIPLTRQLLFSGNQTSANCPKSMSALPALESSFIIRTLAKPSRYWSTPRATQSSSCRFSAKSSYSAAATLAPHRSGLAAFTDLRTDERTCRGLSRLGADLYSAYSISSLDQRSKPCWERAKFLDSSRHDCGINLRRMVLLAIFGLSIRYRRKFDKLSVHHDSMFLTLKHYVFREGAALGMPPLVGNPASDTR